MACKLSKRLNSFDRDRRRCLGSLTRRSASAGIEQSPKEFCKDGRFNFSGEIFRGKILHVHLFFFSSWYLVLSKPQGRARPSLTCRLLSCNFPFLYFGFLFFFVMTKYVNASYSRVGSRATRLLNSKKLRSAKRFQSLMYFVFITCGEVDPHPAMLHKTNVDRQSLVSKCVLPV